MRIAVASDSTEGIAAVLIDELGRRGHEVAVHGALAAGDRPDWAFCAEAAARDVAAGRADQAVVCCWTGTGVSLAASKVPGIRAALCADAYTADGARRWNNANVLALSLRKVSEPLLVEILDAWFAGTASTDESDRTNIRHIDEIAEREVTRAAL